MAKSAASASAMAIASASVLITCAGAFGRGTPGTPALLSACALMATFMTSAPYSAATR